MGLFDFLKQKTQLRGKPASNAVSRGKSAVQELERLRRQIANQASEVGDEAALKAVQEFVMSCGQDATGSVCTPNELVRVCYYAAYKYLPDLVFNQWPKFTELWHNQLPFTIDLAVTAASRVNRHLSAKQIWSFKSMEEKIGDDIDCYVIRYPTPSPFNMKKYKKWEKKIRSAGIGSGGPAPLLGPYYSVVSHQRSSDKKWLHVLGQRPDRRDGKATTIRQVLTAKRHYNCGRGPDPLSHENFLRAIQPLLTENE